VNRDTLIGRPYTDIKFNRRWGKHFENDKVFAVEKQILGELSANPTFNGVKIFIIHFCITVYSSGKCDYN